MNNKRLIVEIAEGLGNQLFMYSYAYALSKKLGYDLQPPENTINNLGYAFMGQGKIDQAIDYFKQNVKMYPNSSNTYDSLAEGYMEKGETKLAIEYYQKVISMDGKSDRIETVIKELKEKLE